MQVWGLPHYSQSCLLTLGDDDEMADLTEDMGIRKVSSSWPQPGACNFSVHKVPVMTQHLPHSLNAQGVLKDAHSGQSGCGCMCKGGNTLTTQDLGASEAPSVSFSIDRLSS
jgi:hypothetical protein